MSKGESLPSTMAAMVLHGHGGIEMLQYEPNWPLPVCGCADVMIKVAACGLNNTDVNTRTGWYSKSVTGATTGEGNDEAEADDAAWGGSPINLPLIQGADVCGRVVHTGDDVPASLMGKRVLVETWLRDWDEPDNILKCRYFGSECNGGFAQYVCVDFRQVHPISNNRLSDAQLATFATSYLTAEHMLDRAGVSSGDLVAITGASGGVGSALIQLANRRGAQTVAITSPAKAEKLSAIGVDAVVDRNAPDYNAALAVAIGRSEATVVADVVGGARWMDYIDLLERGGRYVTSGAIAGPMVELDMRTLYLRDLTLLGSTVTSPQAFRNLVGYIEREEIAPLLHASYPLSELRSAQQAFMEKHHIGKIVVTME